MTNHLLSFIGKRSVVSTKAIKPGKYYHLSVLDRIMEGNHLKIVLYYPSLARRESGELSKKLEENLSKLLSNFLMVTGRLVTSPEGHRMVKCNDAGVRMVDARAKGRVEEWLVNLDKEKELELVHWEDKLHDNPYFCSTFYIQLTKFEEGGLAIGLSCTHLLVDPICAAMFIKAWADSTLQDGKLTSPPLFHPLPLRRPFNKKTNHRHYTHLINHYKSSVEKPSPTLSLKQQTTATLLFTDEMVQACMAITGAQNIKSNIQSFKPNMHSPPFEALAALFWVCISKANGHQHSLVKLSICLDMRSVLGLDKGYFGNCMVYNSVHGKSNSSLQEASNAIREVVGRMDIDGTMDLIEWLESNNDCRSPPLMNDQDHIICANLEGMGCYEAIFEEGLEPIQCSCYVEPALGGGQVLILPRPTGEGRFGRVVTVTLPEDKLVSLLKDDLLLQFSPSILMSMNKN